MPEYKLCELDELQDGEAKGFYHEKGAFFAVIKDGEVYLYRNICPHLGTPLEWQEDQFLDPDGALIQCASHGALFAIETGECLAGPCAGDTLVKAEFKINDNALMLVAS